MVGLFYHINKDWDFGKLNGFLFSNIDCVRKTKNKLPFFLGKNLYYLLKNETRNEFYIYVFDVLLSLRWHCF